MGCLAEPSCQVKSGFIMKTLLNLPLTARASRSLEFHRWTVETSRAISGVESEPVGTQPMGSRFTLVFPESPEDVRCHRFA